MTEFVLTRRVRRPTEAQLVGRPFKEWRQMRRRQGTAADQFQRIIAFAEKVRESPAALRALIRLLGLELQNITMTQVLRQEGDPAIPQCFQSLFFSEYLPLTADGKSLNDIAPQVTRRRAVNMLTDVLLPWPWADDRLEAILLELARGGVHWESDDNHKIELLLPMRVCMVHGGNHSLTAGFALGKVGGLKSGVVRDFTQALQVVRSDGKTFWRTFDHKVVAKVGVMEAAAIWEIARLMIGLQPSKCTKGAK